MGGPPHQSGRVQAIPTARNATSLLRCSRETVTPGTKSTRPPAVLACTAALRPCLRGVYLARFGLRPMGPPAAVQETPPISCWKGSVDPGVGGRGSAAIRLLRPGRQIVVGQDVAGCGGRSRAVVGPDALAPVAVAARLRRSAGGTGRCGSGGRSVGMPRREHPLVEQRAGSLHRAEHVRRSRAPRRCCWSSCRLPCGSGRPRARSSSITCASRSGPSPGLHPLPDALLEERLDDRQVALA